MSPRYEIRELRRRQLTNAALKCIAAKGYDHVTLDDVRKEVGLSKGIASYYFKNREELLVSVIHKMWDNVMQIAKEIWELPEEGEHKEKVYRVVKKYYSDPAVDIVAVIKEGIGFLVRWCDDNQDIIRVILEFWCQVPRNPMITKLNNAMHEFLVTISAIIIKEGMKKSLFKKRNPEAAAYTLLSSITGFAFNRIINKGRYTTTQLEKDLCDLIFGYLEN